MHQRGHVRDVNWVGFQSRGLKVPRVETENLVAGYRLQGMMHHVCVDNDEIEKGGKGKLEAEKYFKAGETRYATIFQMSGAM